MGTEIDLTVGGVMVDWSKNRRGRDHGVLFQPQDRMRTLPESPRVSWRPVGLSQTDMTA